MAFIRFGRQTVWRDHVFLQGVVYEVGPRVHYKFVTLQGLAEKVEALDGAERVLDPGEEAVAETPAPTPPIPEPAPEPVPEPPPAPPAASGRAEVRFKGGSWYDVVVDGEVFNDTSLRKDEAEKMANALNEKPTEAPAGTTQD